jgi:hypothetical protein
MTTLEIILIVSLWIVIGYAFVLKEVSFEDNDWWRIILGILFGPMVFFIGIIIFGIRFIWIKSDFL